MSEANTGQVRAGQSGSAHPAWRGDEVSERAGRVRAQRLYPEGQSCERCGAAFSGGHSVERHHRDGDTLNNALENIARLCPVHHGEVHRMRDAQERRADQSPLGIRGIPPQAIEIDPLEPDAEASYSGVLRTEACVCGGVIVAADNPGMIRAAVELHNATTQHEDWRAVIALRRPTRRHCPCHENGA